MTLTIKLFSQPMWVISPVLTLQVKVLLISVIKIAEDVALSQNTTTQNGFLGAACLTIMWLLFRQRSSHAHTYQQFRGASKVMDVLGAFEGKPMLARKKKKASGNVAPAGTDRPQNDNLCIDSVDNRKFHQSLPEATFADSMQGLSQINLIFSLESYFLHF